MEHQTIIMIWAVAVGFYMAWSIGANDVANAMGTVVGSGTLSIRQAVVIAGLMTVLGAIFVGGHVTATIRKGVIDPALFSDTPDVLLYGMFAILIGAASWVTLATYFKLPVSTTHSIVGSLVGFGLVEVGPGNIKWLMIVFIVASWFISPVVGGIISYVLFVIIKKFIFAAQHPFQAAKKLGPLFIGLVFFVLTLMVLYKGLKPLHLHFSLPTALLIASGAAFCSAAFGFLLMHRIRPRDEEAEIDGVERLAKPLQILSASVECFAHGANDVANAVGPLAAIVLLVDTGSVGSKAPLPIWILILGGVGIMIGILTWGHRVMETIGKRITEITPTRGFAAEFGTATTVLLCSRMGLPVSTTHTSIGNVVGVGMARGFNALNLRVVWSIVKAWFITLPAAGTFTVLIFLLLKALFL